MPDEQTPPDTEQPPEPPARRVRLPGFVVSEETGLGDVIKHVTNRLGVKPCGGCNRRAAALNRRIVFSPRRTSRG
ncbi:hypothetical protein [Nocardia sp. CS682]|uniref:hypothetical protein n=1 Tax=Nocardia sp. CS682 TaxID=1047172 RepID=UPI00107551C4|nr:hypothetical protein [Nocardia sp. CS682]QBS43373.1 hypothetical protein DMB37_27970 [Nocardia sp. CS682]